MELDRICSQAHGPAHVGDLLLLGQQVDHRERRLEVHLGRVGALHAGHVAGELADRDVHPQADAQVRDLAFPRGARGADLALPSTAAEASGDQDAVGAIEPRRDLGVADGLGVDPVDLDLAAVVDGRMLERLGDRQVGVLELHVLADERDPHGAARLAGAARDRLPAAQVGRRRVESEVLLEDVVVDALGVEHQRHLVDVGHVAGRDDRFDREAGEQRDLAADVLRQLRLRAAHDHVGGDSDSPQLVDRVLRGLGLQLAGVADVGHERQVDEHAAAPSHVDGELPDRLEERQRLDVAHRAADLGDHEVDVAGLRHQLDPVLDLVGDVRDHLDGRAEVVAATLAPDHGVVDPARGDVGGAARVRAREPLVVAQVEVGLSAVLGHEHLAVLVGRHRPRVDVDVGVELLQLDVQPAGHQQSPDRSGGDALAKRRDDPAGYEDETRLTWGHQTDSRV